MMLSLPHQLTKRCNARFVDVSNSETLAAIFMADLTQEQWMDILTDGEISLPEDIPNVSSDLLL